MDYNKINNLLGWLCFLIAATVYTLTIEPTASFWDCGEFLSAAYKMQVVHQPGAPLFLMVGKLFSLLAGNNISRIAYWVNFSSAVSSAATILFLFWTITALAKKILIPRGAIISILQMTSIFSAGLVGALAYTFSDTFWFSAVEAEVYAMSSLVTAAVFWAIFKWEAQADQPHADRWLILIAYLIGLSIGIHLLSLLIIPIVACVYYFRRTQKPTNKGLIWAFIIGVLILALIQYGIIQKMIAIAAAFDYFFVNTVGWGFGSGAIIFVIIVVFALCVGIRYSHQKNKPVLNLALLSLVFIIFGYSSFTMIVVRAQAGPNLNNTEPTDAYSLLSYLNREQYGSAPLIYGPYFDAQLTDQQSDGKTYRRGKEKYEEAGNKIKNIYDHNTLFPRMHSTDPSDVQFYRQWMRIGEGEKPKFSDNLGFFFSWQVGEMYMRYFLWNFAGRQNDIQGGGGDYASGNWTTGIKVVDKMRLGHQDKLPKSISENKANNQLYCLPLILGLLGAFWHFKRNQKDAGTVGLLFFFTGLAIVLYLNQDPNQPRERDYAYVGSFYAFAIWIGLGVLALIEILSKKLTPKNATITAFVLSFVGVPVLMAREEWDDHDRSNKYMTRDMAANYLNSCATNAILFTYGVNDTYPLWYVQEVENIRPDVRIVNLSLLGTDWYIRQMKNKMNQSAPLPITMSNEKFVQGNRDVIFYQDLNIEGYADLKNIFDFITSDDNRDKTDYGNGEMGNFLPTKKIKIVVNPAQIIKQGILPTNYKNQIIKEINWTYPRNVVTKAELAMFDILAHNNWQRPIYFANTVPNEQYIGLDKYLYNEGFARRLLPIQKQLLDSTGMTDAANTEIMYQNMMHKFKWGNLKNCHYIDPESIRMINALENSFLSLAQNLYLDGQNSKALAVIQKLREVLPPQFHSIFSAYFRVRLAEICYQIVQTNLANTLMQETLAYLNDELGYYATAVPINRNQHVSDLRSGMYLLQNMTELAKQYKQFTLSQQAEKQFYSIGKLLPQDTQN